MFSNLPLIGRNTVTWHDVARSRMMVPLEPWRNSTPDSVRQLASLLIFDQTEAYKFSQIHKQTDRESTYYQALLYEQRLQKVGPNTFCVK